MTMLLPKLGKDMAVFNRNAVGFAQGILSRREIVLAARQLTRLAIRRGADAQEVWQDVQEVLREGVTGESAQEILAIAMDVAETWLLLAQKARDIWKEAAPEAPKGLDQVQAFERQAREVLTAIVSVQRFSNRPSVAPDAERLERGREDLATGRYQTAEQIHAPRRGQGG